MKAGPETLENVTVVPSAFKTNNCCSAVAPAHTVMSDG